MRPGAILRELVPKGIFAAWLLATSAIGVFVTGMSGDAGPNPATFYLMASLAFYVCAGLAVLCTPMGALFSGGRTGRCVRFAFLASIANPAVALLGMWLVHHAVPAPPRPAAPVVATAVATPVCVTRHSNDSTRLVWISLAIDAGTARRIPADRMLQTAERYCESLPLRPGSELRFGVRTPAPGRGGTRQRVQQAYAFYPAPGERLCIGLYPLWTGDSDPAGGTDDPAWHFTREPCDPAPARRD